MPACFSLWRQSFVVVLSRLVCVSSVVWGRVFSLSVVAVALRVRAIAFSVLLRYAYILANAPLVLAMFVCRCLRVHWSSSRQIIVV